MKVLWFSVTPSMFDEKKYGGWIASLERIVEKYSEDIELAIAFEYKDDRFKVKKGKNTYYIIKEFNSISDRLKEKKQFDYKWNKIRPQMIKIIEDFKPDIIQCFGSEWLYGLIAEYVDIPVVIHMQGFANIYNESSDMVFDDLEFMKCNNFNPKAMFTRLTNKKKNENNLAKERKLMKCNHYFMGRTKWDELIVKYYSSSSNYYYCPEALRPEIYNSNIMWNLDGQKSNRLVTITQAGVLKGNEIILRTARILKEQFDFNYEWNVAGNPKAFEMAEKKTGIKHKDYNINLLGLIDAENVAKELSMSTMYIHPAIIDNSPNSLCEAQVIGCPVVAANVGGISSLVDDGKTGILYPYNEPHMLAFKIMDLCNDRDFLNEISINEKEIARKRHEPQKVFDILHKIYEEINNEYLRRR